MAYTYTDPIWDDAATHLNVNPSQLIVVTLAQTPDAWMAEAHAALLERGFNIGVGVTLDPDSAQVLLRLTKAE